MLFNFAADYRQLLMETRSRHILVDSETAPVIKEAISQLDWEIQLISVGDTEVPDASSYAELLLDDGKGMTITQVMS